jgi:hypothetical protein
VRAFLCLVVIACAPPPRAPAKRGLVDDHAAIVAFQNAWERQVRPKIADPLVRRIDNRMQDVDINGAYFAEQHACREGLERIELLERVRANNSDDPLGLVIFGSPDALLGRDRCWAVLFMGGKRSLDAEGWLDLTGRLLIAWRIPEG